MRRFCKILLKGFLGLVIIMLIAGLFFYWNVSTRWKKYYTVSEIKEYVKMIENSPTLSNNFYAIYDKLYNNDRHKSITSIYINALWNDLVMHKYTENTCWYVNAANYLYILNNKQRERYSGFILAWGLEKYTSSEKCFDYVKNIENKELLSHFNDSIIKDIRTLKDTTEILKYIVISNAPSRYKRNPDLLIKRVEILKEKINKGSR
jgi:hypothetical protein